MNWFKQYVTETKGELKHVSWPTKDQTVSFTFAVIAISVIVSFYLAFFDKVFMLALQKLLFGV